jgi:hypothetical protein
VPSFTLLAIVVHNDSGQIIDFDCSVIDKMNYRPSSYCWDHVADLIDVDPHGRPSRCFAITKLAILSPPSESTKLNMRSRIIDMLANVAGGWQLMSLTATSVPFFATSPFWVEGHPARFGCRYRASAQWRRMWLKREIAVQH